MNLEIGIWEEIKTIKIGDNHVHEEEKKTRRKKRKKLRRKKY